MRLKRYSRITLFFTVVATMFSVCALQAKTLKVAYYSAPVTADPYQGGGVPTSALGFNVYEGLFFNDGYTNLNPGLGESYRWKDGRNLEIKLRKGVKFHDGTDFTARDVVYSLCRMMFARDGKPGIIAGSLKPIKSIDVINDHKINITTNQPYPYLRAKLFYTYIMPAHLADAPEDIRWDIPSKCGVKSFASKAEIDNLEKAIGTGPYKFIKFDKGTGDAELAGFDDYWGGKPQWDKVVLSAVSSSGTRVAGLLAKRFDVIENPTTKDLKLLKSKGFEYTSAPSLRPIYLAIVYGKTSMDVQGTNGKNPFEDIRVRKAVAHAIDRAAIVKKIMGGAATVANQLSPRYMPGALNDAPEIEYNPSKARKLLTDAGYPDGFTITLYGTNDRYTNDSRVLQAIGQYLNRVGIKAKVQAMGKSIFGKKQKAYEMTLYLYGYGHTQGANIAVQRTLATKNPVTGVGQRNLFRYSNSELDNLINQAITGIEGRIKKHEKAALRFVRDEMLVIPLYTQHYIIGHKPELVINKRGDERLLFQNVRVKAQ